MPDRDIYRVLASPVRRRILELLRNGSLTAGDIASEFKLIRQPVSDHLQVLRNSGLVLEEIRGRWHVYHLNTLPVAEADIWLHSC